MKELAHALCWVLAIVCCLISAISLLVMEFDQPQTVNDCYYTLALAAVLALLAIAVREDKR